MFDGSGSCLSLGLSHSRAASGAQQALSDEGFSTPKGFCFLGTSRVQLPGWGHCCQAAWDRVGCGQFALKLCMGNVQDVCNGALRPGRVTKPQLDL